MSKAKLAMKQTQISLFLVVLVIGLVVRVSVLSIGSDQLIKVVPDDAFYYLETARHIAAGDGSTFDGINPTNGYHPLWMLLVLPLAALFKDPWWVTRLTLILGIAFNIGAATLLFATLRRWLNVWYVPVIGAAIYFLNARSIVSSLNGLETMVSSFFFAASLYLVLLRLESPKPSVKSAVLLGLSLGLLFLARTDNVFYIAIMYLMTIWWEQPERRLKVGVVVAGTTALIISPWLLWNYFTFGSFMQSSGFAVPYVLRESFLIDGHTSSELFLQNVKIFIAFIGYQMYRFYLGFPVYVFLPGLIATAFLIVRGWRKPDDAQWLLDRELVKLLWGLAVAAVMLIFVHTFLRWYPRTYYFDQIIILSALGFSLGLALLRPANLLSRIKVNSIRQSSAPAVMILLIVLVPALYSGYKLVTHGQYPHQIEFLDAARWLEQNTAPEVVSAGFNVGITSFFSERDVVNLDGAINTAAFEAIRAKRLFAYAEYMKVRYIVDYDPVMFEMYRYFLGGPPRRFANTVVADIDRPDVDWIESHIKVFDIGQRPDLAVKDDG